MSQPNYYKDSYAVYEHYRNETFTGENNETQSVKILRFKYGWLPIELLFETIKHAENKTERVYKIYRRTDYASNRKYNYKQLSEGFLNYSELHDTIGLENLLL